MVARLRKGDRTAFATLFDGYSPRLYRFSMGYFRNRSDAEEVVQETFIRIWTNRTDIDPDKSFPSFLIAIARNRIYDIIKHKIVERKHRGNLSAAWSGFQSEEEKLMADDLMELMLAVIGKLPGKQRDIMLLRCEGYSNPEIADKMSITVRTVETHISNAYRALRRMVGGGLAPALIVSILTWQIS